MRRALSEENGGGLAHPLPTLKSALGPPPLAAQRSFASGAKKLTAEASFPQSSAATAGSKRLRLRSEASFDAPPRWNAAPGPIRPAAADERKVEAKRVSARLAELSALQAMSWPQMVADEPGLTLSSLLEWTPPDKASGPRYNVALRLHTQELYISKLVAALAFQAGGGKHEPLAPKPAAASLAKDAELAALRQSLLDASGKLAREREAHQASLAAASERTTEAEALRASLAAAEEQRAALTADARAAHAAAAAEAAEERARAAEAAACERGVRESSDAEEKLATALTELSAARYAQNKAIRGEAEARKTAIEARAETEKARAETEEVRKAAEAAAEAAASRTAHALAASSEAYAAAAAAAAARGDAERQALRASEAEAALSSSQRECASLRAAAEGHARQAESALLGASAELRTAREQAAAAAAEAAALRASLLMEREATQEARAAAQAAALRCAEAEHFAATADEKLLAGENARRRLHEQLMAARGNVRVVCRVRPPSAAEQAGAGVIVFPSSRELRDRSLELSVPPLAAGAPSRAERERAVPKYTFAFDKVFPPSASQADVFEDVGMVVQSALDGYKACVIAYGATGSGCALSSCALLLICFAHPRAERRTRCWAATPRRRASSRAPSTSSSPPASGARRPAGSGASPPAFWRCTARRCTTSSPPIQGRWS